MKADAESVELQFATDLERLSHEPIAHALPEVGHFLPVVCIAQREHRPRVNHGLELVVEVASHTLRRAVGIVHLGMPRLEVLQFMHHEVELLVGDDGSVLNVVAIVMLVQLIAQLQDAFRFVHSVGFSPFNFLTF